ncbi:MAG: hypothetical protein COC15_00465 [Legionellales bacterium]|nr:MAG: hypothetical protein COC15_00465 [Legionellales bacterium]
MMLHIVNTENYAPKVIANCLEYCNADDHLLLMGAAKFAVIQDSPVWHLANNLSSLKIYVLESWIKLVKSPNILLPNLRVIHYADFVDLVELCDNNQTWN